MDRRLRGLAPGLGPLATARLATADGAWPSRWPGRRSRRRASCWPASSPCAPRSSSASSDLPAAARVRLVARWRRSGGWCLPVFKTGVAENPGQAGSIPVRLRHRGGRQVSRPVPTRAGRCRAPTPCSPTRGSPRPRAVLGRTARQGRGRAGAAAGPARRDRAGRRRRRRRGRAAASGRPACDRCQRDRRRACTPTSAGRRCRAAAVDAVVAAAGHTDVELDLATGRRARRGRGALAALAARRARRRRRARGEQRRRRAGARRHRAGRRPRDRGQPGRADRDRRRLPPARPAGSRPARGCARSARPTAPHLRDYAAAIGPGHRLRAEGAPVELRRSAGSRPRSRSPSWPRWASPVVADIGSGLLAPAPAAARRAGRRRRRCAPARRW